MASIRVAGKLAPVGSAPSAVSRAHAALIPALSEARNS